MKRLALLGALAGCAGAPTTQFHSLLAAEPAAAARGASHTPAWALEPVTIPAQVDRPQFVVRGADETLVVLEQQRWIAPLADELHAAIGERLAQRLGAPAAAGASVRRARVEVQRFDSAPGRHARLVADWSVADAAGAPALACRFESQQAVGAGYAELAAGHRRAVAALADALAAALLALDAGQPARCPSS